MEITYTEKLQVTACWCGIALAVPSNLYRNAHEDGTQIYCPLGHKFGWSETWKAKFEAEQERVRRERERTQAARDLLLAEERSHAATRGRVTKLKKRIANGVCPCCQRSFANVARHMKSQHPDFMAASSGSPESHSASG